MISLFLDTADKDITIGIINDDKVLYYVNELNDNHLSERFLPLIEAGFKKIDMSIEEVDKIFIVNGPGSFTGVRVGVSVAKVIASSLKKDIVTISELEVLSSTFTDRKYIVPLIDARRDYVYTAMYDSKLKKVINDQYVLYDDFMKYLEDNYDLSSIEFVSHYDIKNRVKPNIDIMKIIKKHIKSRTINPHKVNPNYLKQTEAEENLGKK